MPYTPPSQRSPATSNSNSPVLSRNQSYAQSSNQPTRPSLPRSHSASYLQKHRRTPSIADQKPASNESSVKPSTRKDDGKEVQSHGGLQPIIVARIVESIGLTASPVDSPGSSEDDDEHGRGRQLRDLAETLRESMVVAKRPHSPSRMDDGVPAAAPKPTPMIVTDGSSSPALNAEARKIVHSRSTSELPISTQTNGLVVPIESSSDSEDEGLELRRAPLLRKKSGELVKPALRPSSRRRPSSAPGTPTYSKAVHFNDNIEQVRHFLQLDRPIAVSAGSSPVEHYDSESDYPFGHGEGSKSRVAEWEIRTANFPEETEERRTLPVRVERISLSSDKKNLVGTVAVANIAFQKVVYARFTFDYWKTTSEIRAEYSNDARRKQTDGYDRFNFCIKLSDQTHLETKTLLLCAKYDVNGREYWDNNNNHNFQVDFIKKAPIQNGGKQTQGGLGSLGTIPRSRHSPNSAQLIRPRSFPASSDDDFSSGFGFGSSDFPLREPSNLSVRFKRPGNGSGGSSRRTPAQGNSFSTRYDFGASLSAALATAQDALGDRSGLKLKGSSSSKQSHASQDSAHAVQPVASPSPNSFSTGRPELHSAEYNDLIEKFCYFGSNSPSGTGSPSEGKSGVKDSNLPQSDGIADSGSETNCSSVGSSATNSPPSPKPHNQVDGAHDSLNSTRTSSPTVRASSPRLLPYRSSSPAVSAYQEFPHQGLSAQATQC